MRALSNQLVMQTVREANDPSSPVIILNNLTGRESAPVFGVVKAIGEGDLHHPDVPDLRVGDVLLWDWVKRGPSVIEHGQPYTFVSFNAVLARVESFTEPGETYHALLDQVMTERAPLAMAASISSKLILPDQVAIDGMQSDRNSPTACVYERVVSVGRGIMFPGRDQCACCKEKLRRVYVPDVRAGDLVAFNPTTAESVPWRRRGRAFRFTPYSEIRGQVEE